jgi:oxaloacetate decarboxylase alpha subunit
MPKTKQQMLLRGQNLLGYRHYADDVVEKFVECAVTHGVDVFRVFDAMNDVRNMDTAMKAVKKQGAHAQGTLSYTTSPVHNQSGWLDLAKKIEDMGADSLAIKDMAGILTPYDAYDLVSQLKQNLDIPIALHAHATAGLSSMTQLKAIEAGIDHIDTAISSMSMTYGHSPTESLVAALQGSERDPGLDLVLLEEIAAYFREVRKKYVDYEGALRGVDARILIAQVPGGMLTNMESQLKEQGASDKFDAVLEEIPRVREDLGHIPLVTPTSQIVGTQAVMNVLMGERYKSISKETQGILKGEYGTAPAPFNRELQARVLQGEKAITCRPADLLEPEMDKLTAELNTIAQDRGLTFANGTGEGDRNDVLTYALFPQIALYFFENRLDPSAFEPAPTVDTDDRQVGAASADGTYLVNLEGQEYRAQVKGHGEVHVMINNQTVIAQIGEGKIVNADHNASANAQSSTGQKIKSPLSGNIFQVLVQANDVVKKGQVLIILEAMKMETEIKASHDGVVSTVMVKPGDTVSVNDLLLTL